MSVFERMLESGARGEVTEASVGESDETRVDEFARLIARGESFDDARRAVRIEKRRARAWMSREDWRARVRKHLTTKQEVSDRAASMVSKAMELKDEILGNEGADLRLRNEVATEMLKMKGWDKVYEESVEEFEMSADFEAQVRAGFDASVPVRARAKKSVVRRVEG